MSDTDLLLGKNISKICRTCLTGGELHPIFQECEFPKECVADMLITCTLIDCSERDALPKYVCSDCLQEILISYSFAAKCEKSDKILRKHLSKMKMDKLSNEKKTYKKKILSEKDETATQLNEDLDIAKELYNCGLILPENPTDVVPTEEMNIPVYIFNEDPDEKTNCDYCENDYECISNINSANLVVTSSNQNHAESNASKENSEINQEINKNNEEIYMSEPNTFVITENTSVDQEKCTNNQEMCVENEELSINTENCIEKSEISFIEKEICTNDSNNVVNIHNICEKNDVENTNLSCYVCQKSFGSKPCLKQHMLIHDEKRYLCSFCGKSTSTMSGLSVHLRCHSDVKRYTCDICYKKFTQSGSLKTHKLLHYGIKAFSCDICQKGFIQKHHLKCHMLQHVTDKNFVCNICDKRFSYAGALKRHMTRHNGPFSCSICKRKFSSSSMRNKHEKTHQNI